MSEAGAILQNLSLLSYVVLKSPIFFFPGHMAVLNSGDSSSQRPQASVVTLIQTAQRVTGSIAVWKGPRKPSRCL